MLLTSYVPITSNNVGSHLALIPLMVPISLSSCMAAHTISLKYAYQTASLPDDFTGG